jgi:predicted nucleic acid-binding protein
MTVYVLDSCILIDLLRGREDRVAGVRRILDAGGMLAGCAITLA